MVKWKELIAKQTSEQLLAIKQMIMNELTSRQAKDRIDTTEDFDVKWE